MFTFKCLPRTASKSNTDGQTDGTNTRDYIDSLFMEHGTGQEMAW